MKTLNFLIPILLTLGLSLAACSDQPSVVAEKENALLENTVNASPNAATVNRQTFTVPFPPVPGVDFAPVPAPCLELGEPLKMSGTWSGWFQTVTAPNGRRYVTEHIDYSGITLQLNNLVWEAGPGASEPIIINNIPLTEDATGEAAFVAIHEFHARFISQNDMPDLQVNHRVRILVGPDGELLKTCLNLLPQSA